MGNTVFICIAVSAFIAFSCGSSKQDAKYKTKIDGTTNLKQDSIPGKPIFAPPPPAPGTVQLRGKILSYHSQKSDSSAIYYIKVLNVLHTGSSTPPVVKGDSVYVHSPKKIDIFKENNIITCTLQYSQPRAELKKEKTSWQLLKWKH